MAAPLKIALERPPGRTPRLRIVLPQVLATASARDARDALSEALAPLAGLRIGLILDARAVEHAEPGSLEALAELELDAGRAALVGRLARLVSDLELARLSNEQARASGIDNAIRSFTSEAEAEAFLEGA